MTSKDLLLELLHLIIEVEDEVDGYGNISALLKVRRSKNTFQHSELEFWCNRDFSELAVWPNWERVIKEPLVLQQVSHHSSTTPI